MSETDSSQSEQWLQAWCSDHGLPNISLSLRHRLQQVIDAYLQWMKNQGHSDSTCNDHQRELEHFIAFVQHGRWGWDQIFSLDVLILFQKRSAKATDGRSEHFRGICLYTKKLNGPSENTLCRCHRSMSSIWPIGKKADK